MKKQEDQRLIQILKRLEKAQTINQKTISRIESEWKKQQSVRTAYVQSAVPLTDEEKKELAVNLGFIYGVSFIVRNRVSKSVIAGLRIRIGSKIIDTTIQNQLEKVKQSLLKNAKS